METHPKKGTIEVEKVKKRVHFRSSYEEITPPEYKDTIEGSEDETGKQFRVPLPSASAKPSAIKKQKIKCKSKSIDGFISISSGQVIFSPGRAHPTEPQWTASLGEILHLDVEDANDENGEYTLVFILNNRIKKQFTNIPIESNAFQTLVDDAETLGFVLVVDQLISSNVDTLSNTITPTIAGPDVDAFDVKSKQKKRASFITGIVSKNMKRFVNDKFNLDLTYVSRRMIVMAYPGDGVKGMAWNNAKDVKRFFESRHAHAYMIYNLNSDPAFIYDPAKFDGRVRHFGFADHSPPPLNLLVQICHDIASFLRQQPCNVVGIHCKAGKGRSGTIACAWLLHSHLFDSASKSIDYFDAVRTNSSKAISLPSQVRYVYYIEKIVAEGLPNPNIMKLTKIEFCPSPIQKGTLIIQVTAEGKTSETEAKSPSRLIEIAHGIALKEDVKIDIFYDTTANPIFSVGFNTRMLEGKKISFERNDLDGEREYKSFKLLPPEFSFVLHYELSGSAARVPRRLSISSERTPTVRTGSSTDIISDISTISGNSAIIGSNNNNNNSNSNNNNSGVISKQVRNEEDFPDGYAPKVQRKLTGWISTNRSSENSENSGGSGSYEPENLLEEEEGEGDGGVNGKVRVVTKNDE